MSSPSPCQAETNKKPENIQAGLVNSPSEKKDSKSRVEFTVVDML